MRKSIGFLLTGVAFAFGGNIEGNYALKQPGYIQQSYNRDYYYHVCMRNHNRPITSVYTMAKDIANQLVCSELIPMKMPIGVSVIVDLNSLHETTNFGRLLSEDLISELQRKNMAVVDLRSQTFMLINNKGEFYLSRDIKNLRKQYRLGYVLVGTYSVGDYSTSVNARIIDVLNGFVIASAHASIPTSIINDLLYNEPSTVPTLELKGSNNNNNISMMYQYLPPTPPPTPMVQAPQKVSPKKEANKTKESTTKK